MAKKKRRIKVRRQWKIKPLTKVKPSAKIYRRENARRATRRDLEDA